MVNDSIRFFFLLLKSTTVFVCKFFSFFFVIMDHSTTTLLFSNIIENIILSCRNFMKQTSTNIHDNNNVESLLLLSSKKLKIFSNDSQRNNQNNRTGIQSHQYNNKRDKIMTISTTLLPKYLKFSSSWIIRKAIILMAIMFTLTPPLSILVASSSSSLTLPLSLQNYFTVHDDQTSTISARPTPFSPDYHPECDIILPASYSLMNSNNNYNSKNLELSPPVINLDIQDDHLPPPPPAPPAAAAPPSTSSSYYYPSDNDAITNELLLTNDHHNHNSYGSLGGISFRSSASTMDPVLQKYIAAITG